VLLVDAFSLVYLICNTIMNLITQEVQVACFRNGAAHLRAGGCFVIKVVVPELRRLPPGETLHVFAASDEHWGIDEYDIANQVVVSHHFETFDGRLERSSMPFRYVWPSELDLMAELAGMRLRERWEGWDREGSRAKAASTSPCGESRSSAIRCHPVGFVNSVT
jgi:hypothetical protein